MKQSLRSSLSSRAAKAGLDPKAVRETIEWINRGAASGKEAEFCRTGHFFKPLKAPYCISARGCPVRCRTEGCLEVNPMFQVLRSTTLKPIPGLYAVGAVSCRRFRLSNPVSLSLPFYADSPSPDA